MDTIRPHLHGLSCSRTIKQFPHIHPRAVPSSLAAVPRSYLIRAPFEASNPAPWACSIAPQVSVPSIARTSHRNCVARATSDASNAAVASDADAMFQSQETPSTFVGSVEVTQTRGRGRGLVATKGIPVGDLLLVTAPLGVSYASGDEDEEGEEGNAAFNALQQELLSRSYSEADLAWLTALNGPPDLEGEGVADEDEDAELPLPDMTHVAGAGMLNLPCPKGLTADILEGIIQANAYDAPSDDPDLAMAASGLFPEDEVMGIYPQYAMMNHSCVPNTISYTHKGMLISRLARPAVKKGAEMFTNYLGSLLFSPVDVRQEALEMNYGFICSCARCREEGKTADEFKKLMNDIYDSCTDELREDMDKAMAKGNKRSLTFMKDHLASYAQVLDVGFTKKNIDTKAQIWLQASMFELYALLDTVLFSLDEVDLRLIELLQALAGSVSPGCDLHCYYAVRLLQATLESEAAQADPLDLMPPPPSGSVAASKPRAPRFKIASVEYAEDLCFKAFTARFGKISRATYRAILGGREQIQDKAIYES